MEIYVTNIFRNRLHMVKKMSVESDRDGDVFNSLAMTSALTVNHLIPFRQQLE